MKKFLAVVVLLIVAVVAVGFVLPADYEVERETQIAATPADIHALVGDLANWPQWSPWEASDPSIVITPGPQATGVGASQSWAGDSGSGSLVFTSSSAERGVAFDLSFEGGQWRAKSTIDYVPSTTGTTVRWHMQGSGGSAPVGGYFALLVKFLVGGMYEQGLANLKSAAEASG